MANKDPSKTEKPTDKRLSEAKQEGNVLQSQDVTGIVTMVGGTILLILTLKKLPAVFDDIFLRLMKIDCTNAWTVGDLSSGIKEAFMILGALGAPMLIGIIILAIVGVWGQIGIYIETKPLEWKLSKMKPSFKKVLPNMQNLVKLLTALAKAIVIGFLAYLALRKDMKTLILLPLQPLSISLPWFKTRLIIFVMKVLFIFISLAVIDYLWKRKEYMDGLMMSKQEIKDENKNSEGNPQVKGKIRSKMRQLSLMRLIQEVPQADVVVTNPTHVAIALKYAAGLPAPQVVAKGLRKRALRIKKIAAENGVPIVENPPLARAIYRKTPNGGFIHSRFFTAVAMILARLQRQGKRNFKQKTAGA